MGLYRGSKFLDPPRGGLAESSPRKGCSGLGKAMMKATCTPCAVHRGVRTLGLQMAQCRYCLNF